MIDRRTFLKGAAAAAAGGIYGVQRGGAWAAQAPTRGLERIGLQLYTVRSLMQQDLAGTLEAVADIGYDEVEFAGYFDHSPEEVKAVLERVGLDAPSTHVPIDALRQDLAGAIETARAVGHRYLVCPWLAPEERASIELYKGHAALFNEAGKACREAGLRFGYHNHDFEFTPTDGQVPFDVLLDETDPELVEIELDLFWVTKGGHDPLSYIERYPGRFTLCHVKDMSADGEMVAVGAGRIDFAAIFAQAEQAGLEHFFVEHDNPEDPMASIATSYQHLEALRF